MSERPFAWTAALAIGVTLTVFSGRVDAQDISPAPAPDDPPHIELTQPPAPSRPGILIPMYVGLIGLQAFDGYSTIHGTGSGGSEENPLVGGLADRPAAFWTIKAVSTVTTIYFAERLWRDRHKTQAIALMVVANVTMGIVAARNATFLRSQ